MRRTWKIWLPISSLLVIILAGWFLFAQSDVGRYSSRLEEEVAKAERLGIATTPTALTAQTTVPDASNAARIYNTVLPKLSSPHAPPAVDELSKLMLYRLENWNRISTLLKGLAPQLSSLKAASKLPGVDFKRPWQNGPAVLLPEMAQMKMAAKLLCVRAALLSHQGKPLEALDDVETALRIGVHAGMDPTLIGKLVDISIGAIAWGRLQRVVNEHPTPAVLARAKGIVQNIQLPDIKPAVSGGVSMIRVAYVWLAKDNLSPQQMLTGGGEMGGRLRLARFSSFRKAFEARTLEMYTDLYQRLPNDPNDYVAADEALKHMDKMLGIDSFVTQGANEIMPVFGQIGDALVATAARKAVALAAIRLLEAGKPFPQKLPFATSDPFGGNPLKYKLTKTGFIVYSLDRDRRDDGGVQLGEEAGSSKRDLGWRFPEGRIIKTAPSVPSNGPGAAPAPRRF